MILGLEIGMLLAGLYALFRGRLPLNRHRVVRGAAARLTGVILLLPLPLAFVVVAAYTLLTYPGTGRAGSPTFDVPAVLLEAGCALACLVGALALAFGFSRPQEGEAEPRRAAGGSEAAEDVVEVHPVDDAPPAPTTAPPAGLLTARPARPPAGRGASPRPVQPAPGPRSRPVWPWLLLAGVPVVLGGLCLLGGVACYWLAAQASWPGAMPATRPVAAAVPPGKARDDAELLAAQQAAARARDEALQAQRAAQAAQDEVRTAKQEAELLRRARDQAEDQARRQAEELRNQTAAARKQAEDARAGMLAEGRKAAEALRQIDQARQEALQAGTRAALSLQAERAAKQKEAQAHYRALVIRADRDVQEGRPLRADDLLNACAPEVRGWEWHVLKRLVSPPMKAFSWPTQAENVRFSPDGKRLGVVGRFPDELRLLDVESGNGVVTFPHDGAVIGFAFGPGGKLVVTSSGKLRVWDANGKAQPALEGPTQTGAVVASPDGKWLAAATASDGPGITLWDLEARKAVHTWPLRFIHPPALAFSPDGRRLACTAWMRSDKGLGAHLTVYDVASRGVEYTLLHVGGLVEFSPDGRRLAALGSSREVYILDAADGRRLATLVLDEGDFLRGLAFHADGRLLATAGEDGAVRLWDTQTGAVVRVLRHRGPAGSVAFSPDGSLLAVADRRADGSRAAGEVRLWQLRAPEALTIRVPGKAVRSLDFARDGQSLVTAQDDGGVAVWDASTGEPLRKLAGHRGAVRAVAYRPDGKQIASAAVAEDGGAGELVFWDAATGRPVFRHPLQAADDLSLAYSVDGKMLACVGRRNVGGQEESELGLWSDDGRARLLKVQEKGSAFNGVAISPDGVRVFVACRDANHLGEVRLWELPNTQVSLHLLSARSTYTAVATAAGPDRLITVSQAGRVVVQDLPTKQYLIPQERVTFSAAEVRCLAASPDGSRLATAGAEDVVRLWDLAAGAELLSPRAPGVVHAAAFSPDGRRLAAGGADRADGAGFVRIWDGSAAK
jgi:WD40 repeat protein